ncbi:MAG TPA: hypothetical protein VFJ22_21055, partial [Dermatophilaceae bacterium]|nr:hypothetical protein [Dermatophilaceae bacterium]
MTQFHDYLAEEVAVDYGDGIISRREALRRLGLLGVGGTVAAALLAACDPAVDEPGPTPPPAGPP